MYFTVITDTGLAKLAAATPGTPLVITHVAVGDGGGVYVAPVSTWTALTNEIRRDAVNRVYQSSLDATVFIVEGFLPKTVGGFTIREVGLFDSAGDLIAAAAYPATYKATEAEGGSSDMYVSTSFKHSNSTDVAISVDPSLIYATQQWVKDNNYGKKHAEYSASGLLRYLPFEVEDIVAEGAGGDFGYSAALSADGNTAIVGAYLYNASRGSAYVFTRDVSGSWILQQELTASDGAAGDYFGWSVSLSADGNTAIAGAYLDDVGANSTQGSAYVYTRDGAGTWTEQDQLTASDGAASDQYGYSVTLSADGYTAIVGAYSDDVGANVDQGSAYVYTRDGAGVWTEQDQLTASDGAAGDRFGCSVALSANGNTAIVGAHYDVVTVSNQGSAYVYTRDGAGAWTQQDRLNPGDAANGDQFGWSVALSADGNTALVGAYSDNVGANSNQGSAYLFTRDGAGVWTEQDQLTASDGAANDQLGSFVALSSDGNTALVGAFFDDVGANSNQGSAYVFTRDGAGVWIQQAQFIASDGVANDRLGRSVALSTDGNTAIAGAYGAGKAYIYTRIF